MEIKFSLEFTTVLSYAREEAMRTGSYSIAADHLLLAVIRHRDNAACEALTALGIDLEELKAFVDGRIFHEHGIAYAELDKVTASRSAQNVLNMAGYEALREEAAQVELTHLLVALSRSSDAVGRDFLTSRGLDPATILSYLAEHRRPAASSLPPRAPRAPAKRLARPFVIIADPTKKQLPS